MQPEDDKQKLREIKHDIKNQLSNVYFAIDQLRHELSNSETNSFTTFCIDTIANSCQAINKHIEDLN
ncbi:hypothetical protein GCM10027037_22070 [Mucilaginibacter koreensis]